MVIYISIACITDDQFKCFYPLYIDIGMTGELIATHRIGRKELFAVTIHNKLHASLGSAVGIDAVIS